MEQLSSLGRSFGVDFSVFIRYISYRSVSLIDHSPKFKQWRIYGVFNQPHGSGPELRGHVVRHYQQFGEYHFHIGTVISWLHRYRQRKIHFWIYVYCHSDGVNSSFIVVQQRSMGRCIFVLSWRFLHRQLNLYYIWNRWDSTVEQFVKNQQNTNNRWQRTTVKQ